MSTPGSTAKQVAPGVSVRRLALDALLRIDEGAYANLTLGPLLESSGLDVRDRSLAAELVYGTTRMARACDFVLERFVHDQPDAGGRRALRLGVYQLRFTRIPAHAAVAATVSASPKRLRGFVNAILRKVAAETSEPAWPDLATELSYPTWIVDQLTEELGEVDATAALRAMNVVGAVDVRADGYTQNRASQWVAEAVGASDGELVADLCAAPGGKTTALAGAGAQVAALDLRPARVRHLHRNIAQFADSKAWAVTGDARRPPLRPAVFDHVLVDAPCSGLGVLHRRPDARWRVAHNSVDRLADLQLELLGCAVGLLRPGGQLVYSVCTLTNAETVGVAQRFASAHPTLSVITEPPASPLWRPHGTGFRLLPQDGDTDGMALFRFRNGDGTT